MTAHKKTIAEHQATLQAMEAKHAAEIADIRTKAATGLYGARNAIKTAIDSLYQP
jgi:hypothetical protein